VKLHTLSQSQEKTRWLWLQQKVAVPRAPAPQHCLFHMIVKHYRTGTGTVNSDPKESVGNFLSNPDPELKGSDTDLDLEPDLDQDPELGKILKKNYHRIINWYRYRYIFVFKSHVQAF
jgi:hypothetical protein